MHGAREKGTERKRRWDVDYLWLNQCLTGNFKVYSKSAFSGADLYFPQHRGRIRIISGVQNACVKHPLLSPEQQNKYNSIYNVLILLRNPPPVILIPGTRALGRGHLNTSCNTDISRESESYKANVHQGGRAVGMPNPMRHKQNKLEGSYQGVSWTTVV